jgi:hypothetical protein
MSDASPVDANHQPGPAPTDRPTVAGAGVELGRLEQLVEVGAAHDPGGGGRCVGDPVSPAMPARRPPPGLGGRPT